MAEEFSYPVFYNYPPYFTLQPVKDTQQKQRQLWRDLILRYCKHHKIFIVSSDESGDFQLFHNRSINRKLNREARLSFLEACVQTGNGLWLDKQQRQCLILWKTVPEWAGAIYSWARSLGLVESVVTLDEVSGGDDVRGTELEGLHREVLLRALRLLEQQGKAKVFKGESSDEAGVKFF